MELVRFVTITLAMGTYVHPWTAAAFVSVELVVRELALEEKRSADPDKTPSSDELAKIMRAFVAREPRIGLLGKTFPGIKAQIYFEDRHSKKVRFDTSVEFGSTYDVMLFFSLRLDETLTKVIEYKCLMFGAYYLPPNATNVSQSSPFVTFPFAELEEFCKNPEAYAEEHVGNALKKS